MSTTGDFMKKNYKDYLYKSFKKFEFYLQIPKEYEKISFNSVPLNKKDYEIIKSVFPLSYPIKGVIYINSYYNLYKTEDEFYIVTISEFSYRKRIYFILDQNDELNRFLWLTRRIISYKDNLNEMVEYLYQFF